MQSGDDDKLLQLSEIKCIPEEIKKMYANLTKTKPVEESTNKKIEASI